MASYLKNKTVAIQPNSLPQFDLTVVFQWLVGSVTFIFTFYKLVDAYYAHKRRANEEFIRDVVKATLDSCLTDMRNDFHEFKIETKKQISEINTAVMGFYKKKD